MPVKLPPEDNGDPNSVYVEDCGEKYRIFTHKDFVAFRDFISDEDGWHLEHKQPKIKVFSKPVPPGLPGGDVSMFRLECEFPGLDPTQLYNALHDPDYRKTWDENMIKGINIVQLSPNCDIGYYSLKFPWPMQAREYLNMRAWMEFTNGDFIIMNRSVLHPKYPETKDYTRALSYNSGYYIQPLEGADTGVRLLFMTHGDPMGSIPKSVLSYATKKSVPGIMLKLESNAEKYADWSDKTYSPGHVHPWTTPKRDWDQQTTRGGPPVSLVEGGLDASVSGPAADDDCEVQGPSTAAVSSEEARVLQSQLEDLKKQLAQQVMQGGGGGWSNADSLAPVAPRQADECRAIQQYRSIINDALIFVDRQYIQEGRAPSLAEYLTRLRAVIEGVRRTVPANL